MGLAKLSSNVNLNQSQWTHSLQERMVRHNKDLRIICQDGSLQIDPSVLMSFMRDRTSFLRLVMNRLTDFGFFSGFFGNLTDKCIFPLGQLICSLMASNTVLHVKENVKHNL